jgi:hypothetical protein
MQLAEVLKDKQEDSCYGLPGITVLSIFLNRVLQKVF